MVVLWIVWSYVAAFVILGLAGWLAELGLLVALPMLRVLKILGPVLRFMAEIGAALLGVYAVGLAARSGWIRASITVVLPIALIQFANAVRRVAKIYSGRSGALEILARAGEPESYNPTLDLLIEYGALAGLTIGYVAGVRSFLSGAPLM